MTSDDSADRPSRKTYHTSPEERAGLIRLYLAGQTLQQIATSFGRDPTTIRDIVRKAGIRRPNPRPPVVRLKDPAIVKVLGTVTDRTVAEALGCSRVSVARHRRAHRIPGFRRVRLFRGMLSLDYAFESGRSFYEIVKDDSCSDWLEEMGATVW